MQAEEQREKLRAFTDPQLVALDTAGYKSFDDVTTLTDAELLAIPGIGESTLKAWRESVPEPQPEPLDRWPGDRRDDECPVCRLPLEPYEGDNPLKQGTAWCPDHGRVRLEAS